jgi:hypothetical protein
VGPDLGVDMGPRFTPIWVVTLIFGPQFLGVHPDFGTNA